MRFDAGALMEQARRAKERARAPLSGFSVGAALLGESGRVYAGCNAEWPGAPIGCTLHAEMTALACARCAGERGLVALAVTASPCGGCRQMLAEHAPDLTIYCPGGETTARGLLPQGFELDGRAKLFPAEPLAYRGDDGEEAAREALKGAFTPYTGSGYGCALRDVKGRWYCGATLESGAYNPTLSALACALSVWLVGDRTPIDRLWLCGGGCTDERPLTAAWAESRQISWTCFDPA